MVSCPARLKETKVAKTWQRKHILRVINVKRETVTHAGISQVLFFKNVSKRIEKTLQWLTVES